VIFISQSVQHNDAGAESAARGIATRVCTLETLYAGDGRCRRKKDETMCAVHAVWRAATMWLSLQLAICSCWSQPTLLQRNAEEDGGAETWPSGADNCLDWRNSRQTSGECRAGRGCCSLPVRPSKPSPSTDRTAAAATTLADCQTCARSRLNCTAAGGRVPAVWSRPASR